MLREGYENTYGDGCDYVTEMMKMMIITMVMVVLLVVVMLME